ncbi:unnamed protein product [Amoebophrya sp. A120]|nr:unnamed protein product [Amoebophrya sp. A120]|eukprot:GSA120T00017256001.1
MSRDAGKLAVFNLPDDCKESELEDLFGKYGKLTRACIRQTRGGDTMAFVEFTDSRDAEDAKKDRHGYEFADRRLRVEFSAVPRGGRGDSRGRKDSRGRRDSRRRGGRRSPPRKGKGKGVGLRDSYHKVEVSGMPETASWQDVKDFLRKAAAVKFTDIDPHHRDVGIGGFDDEKEAARAVKDLDDTTFTARDGEKKRVRVRLLGAPGEAGGNRSRSRSRSPAGGRSRSRSRSRGSRR